jgi:undecaprenyl pyrophosphate phosphatase UppP
VLTRALDATVDAAVVAFSVFTVAYHGALVLGAPVAVTTVVWLVVSIVAIVVTVRLRPGAEPDERDVDVEPRADLATASLAIGAIAALVVGTTLLDHARWWLFDVTAVVALLFAGAAVLRARRVPRAQPAIARVGAVVALVVAAAFALGAVVTVRPDADDVLLVNRSVWIAQHGSTFPERDTLFSD